MRGRSGPWPRLAIGTLVAVYAMLAATPPPADAATRPAVQRVLIVSLPGVAWPDLEGADLPNLNRLFQQSALGALVTRTAGRRTSAGGGYLTIGAGSRAEADDLLIGQAFEPTDGTTVERGDEESSASAGCRSDRGRLRGRAPPGGAVTRAPSADCWTAD